MADPGAVTRLVERLASGAPDEVQNLLRTQLTSIVQANTGALTAGAVLGLVSRLWTAASGFDKLIEGLNIAYGRDDDPRPFWKRRLLALGFTLATIGLAILMVVVVTTAARLGGGVGIVAGWSMAALAFGAALAVFYRYGPQRSEPHWVWVSAGSVFTVVVWIVATVLFGFYVSSFGSYNQTYGSLGAVVVTMLWLYITAAIVVVVGGELNAEAERASAS